MSLDEPKQIELSLVKTLKESSLVEVSANLADAVISIPVLGTIAGLYKATGNISTYLFAKKIHHFLMEIKDVPQAQRRAHVDRLTEDDKYQEQVGETLLMLLDRMNSITKAAMMGKAFRAYLLDEVTYEQLQALYHALDFFDLTQADAFRKMYTHYVPAHMQCLVANQHFLVCGLADLRFDTGRIDIKPTRLEIAANDLGRLFLKTMF